MDRYVVEAVLGEGGMAVVYRVKHHALHTRHALKILSHAPLSVRERALQEGRIQAKLRHVNLVSVSDVLDVDGTPALLMDLVNGPALDEWLANYRPPLAEVLAVFRGALQGIAHAHVHGMVHRDLKPANILLHREGGRFVPKIADFGIAKADDSTMAGKTRTGAAMGTPSYMAPEQIRDAAHVDRRADIYSLGCTLYEMIVGRRAYESSDTLELFNRIARGEHVSAEELVPDLPAAVVGTLSRCMNPDRSQRPVDCLAVLELLGGIPPHLVWDQKHPREAVTPLPTALEGSSPGGQACAALTAEISTPAPAPRRDAVSREPASPAALVVDDPSDDAAAAPLAWAKVGGGLGVLVGLAGLGLGLGALGGAATLGWMLTQPVPPARVPVPAGVPASDPVPLEPIAPAPVAPAPSAVEVPAPIVRVLDPAPVSVAPPVPADPTPPPEPAVEPGGFSAAGATVRLKNGGGTYGVGDPVPSGSYRWTAVFADTSEASGSVEVASGQHLSFSCDLMFGACTLR